MNKSDSISPFVLYLALIPIADAIFNQLFSAEAPASGSLSVFQMYRGAILAATITATVAALVFRPKIGKSIASVVALLGASIAIFAAKELISTGSVARASIVAYIQVFYWMIMWVFASLVCRTPKEAYLVLAGFAVGAMISATSVLVFFALGTGLTDAYQGIRATSGAFFSAKGLVGSLVIGGFITLYLCRKRFQIVGMAIGLSCFAAVAVTFNRSGLLALFVSMLWVAKWYSRHGASAVGNTWARSAIISLFVFGCIGIVSLGVEAMLSRWEDLSDFDTAGSGRLINWRIALQWWVDASWIDKLLGIGHSGMMSVILVVKGVAIHTHSDLFDFLIIGGVLGVVVLCMIYRAFWTARRRLDAACAEYALMTVVSLTFIITSLATGQTTQPTVMTSYVVVLSCLPVAAGIQGVAVASRSRTFPATAGA